tara:strand:- start:123 stop:401 length:279 start_codon:yes stop_codon:yes gene_type:complete
MKVKIMQRSVYHKYAEIEVEVPDLIIDGENEASCDVHTWLIDNEQDWVDILDTKINISEFVFGNGMDTYDWTDKDAESEWMYMTEHGIGGHL